jgi:uroporphyrinogen-III synthase
LGYTPIIAALLDIHPLRAALPAAGRFQAILATSGNATRALPSSHRDLPLFAVGEATAARARAAGFTRVRSANGNACALAALVAKWCADRAAPLLLVTGRGHGRDLAADLRSRGFSVIRRAVYAAVPVTVLPCAARAELASGRLVAALFFSAETARQCIRLVRAARLDEAVRPVEALAIGEPAAVALRALPWRRIRVAERPNQKAMLALLK